MRAALCRAPQVVAAAVLAVLAAGADDATAQPMPYAAPSIRADAYSAAENAAALRFVRGAHAAVAFEQSPAQAGSERVGAYGAWSPAWLLGLGFAVAPDADQTRTWYGVGVGTARASVGLGRERWHDTARRAAGPNGVTTLTTMVRPLSWWSLSAGVAGLNLGAEDAFAERVEGRVGTGLGTSDGALRVDAGYVRRGEGADRAHATVIVRPSPVLRLFVSGGADDGGADVQAGVHWSMGRSGAAIGAGSRGGDVALVAAVDARTDGPAWSRRGAYLRVDLVGDFDELPAWSLGGVSPAFVDTLLALRRAADDDRIAGVFVNLGGVTAGFGQLHEVRAALEAVQAAGKRVVAYYDAAGFRDLYVGSVADFAAAPPTLSVLTTGLGVSSFHVAELLTRLGVTAQFVRVGDYKSAPERFTETGPTAPSRTQLAMYLDDVWAEVLRGIAAGVVAGVEGEEDASTRLEAALADAPLTPARLQALGLLDAVVYRDALQREVENALGGRFDVVRDVARPADEGWSPPREIVVLHIAGEIVEGDSSAAFMGRRTGARTVSDLCRSLADDRRVAAVVVRVDSPGGSAGAADTMHRSISRLAARKPVFLSLGDVAASGGMYAAAVGRPIHATPSTLTGSIGVYAGSFGVDAGLARLGVGVERVSRGGVPNLFDGRTWTQDERAAVRRHIDGVYRLFVESVAAGRGMTVEAVDQVAQGRIWSGMRARDHGLVDSLDGFLGAYEAALAEVAGSAWERDRVIVRHEPAPRPSISGLVSPGDLIGAEADALLGVLGPVASELSAAFGGGGEAMARVEFSLHGL